MVLVGRLLEGWGKGGNTSGGEFARRTGTMGAPIPRFSELSAIAKTMPVIPDVVQREGSNPPEAVALATSRPEVAISGRKIAMTVTPFHAGERP
jgi:hypothetical protein